MTRALTVRLDDDTDAALKEMAKEEPDKSTAEIVREAIALVRSVVYFVRRADGAVKIGFTAALPTRLTALTAEYGPIKLEAFRPGAKADEADVHTALATCRLGRSEWFRGAQVEKTIRSVVAQHGPPDLARIESAELVGVRLPATLLVWLKAKRAAFHKDGLYVSIQGVIRQQLERMKHIEEARSTQVTKRHKKARPHP